MQPGALLASQDVIAALLALTLASPAGKLEVVTPNAPVTLGVGQTALVQVKLRVTRPKVVAIPPIEEA